MPKPVWQSELEEAMTRMVNDANVFNQRQREFAALPRWRQEQIHDARQAAANLRRLKLEEALHNVGASLDIAWAAENDAGCHCGCGCC